MLAPFAMGVPGAATPLVLIAMMCTIMRATTCGNNERVLAGASEAVSAFVDERNRACHPVNVERGPC